MRNPNSVALVMKALTRGSGLRRRMSNMDETRVLCPVFALSEGDLSCCDYEI